MKRTLLFQIAVVCTLIFLHTTASSQETYRFERMFPTLKQPWYFGRLGDIAIDSNWNVYVESNDRILKLTSDGEFITELDFSGRIAVDTENNIYVMRSDVTQKLNPNGDVIAEFPFGGSDIALDLRGNIYVLTNDRKAVQKFDSSGTEITEWFFIEEWVWGYGITVDTEGYVYVLHDYSVERFTSDGSSSIEWNLLGWAEYYLGIDVDSEGNVYVAGRWDNTGYIHKYTSDGGTLLSTWESSGVGDELHSYPHYLAIDPGGNAYVVETCGGFTESCHYLIRKFTSDLTNITFWGSSGYADGKFHWPAAVTADSSGNIYVTEQCTTRIQKFTAQGEFITSWDAGGYTNASNIMCAGIGDIAIGPQGNVYIAHTGSNRVQKFTSGGTPIATWGSWGDYDVYATFDYPLGITVDQAGNVYVAGGWGGGLIQQFTSDGIFIDSWNTDLSFTPGYSYGVLAIGPQGNIYSTGYDSGTGGNLVQKFSPNGVTLDEWGISGGSCGITVDQEGNVYIGDDSNHRIQKCNNNGTSCIQWGRGGTNPGEMIEPSGIAVKSDGKVIIADTLNNRIQVFTREDSTGNTKAVIVAGGGPYPGNNLWDATQMTANFAWWTLLHQGFTKDDIYYLSANTDLDIDGDDESDVFNDATTVILKDILENLADDGDVDSVLLYMTDHGGEDTFSMSGGEILHVSNNVDNPGHDLASWLDALEPKLVTVVYEACESGSFVDDLQGGNRIIITSSASDEQAKFLNQGTISFSYFFWSYIFNGASLDWAFSNASQAVNFVFSDQTPQMVGDTEHIGIGNETEGMIGDAPAIGGEVESTPPELTLETSAVLSVDGVVDPNNDSIIKVWAVVWPPDYETGSVDDPLLDLPTVDLERVGDTRYEAEYSEFHAPGIYQIAVYAMDEQGNTSIPKFTTVPKSISRRAVIVAGETGTNIDLPMIEYNLRLAYNTLISQHYDSADIYLMSNTTILDDVTTYLPTIINFKEDCLDRFIGNDETIENLDLTIYLIGASENGNFILNDDPEEYETLSAGELDEWLDELQSAKRGRTTVICDFDQSGAFIEQHILPEGSQRITITSTGEETAAYFKSQGNISLSSFLWDQLAAGATIRDAFIYARKAITYCSLTNDVSFSCYMPQLPLIDANSNGAPNETTDYDLVEGLRIGDGIVSADDPPQIRSASVVRNGEMITITVEEISSLSPVNRVWAIIKPLRYCPGSSEGSPQVTVEENLEGPDEEGKYTCTYPADYACKVTVYANSGTEEEPNISLPFETRIYQEGGDIYEPDNDASEANVIVVNHPTAQPHTFHQCDNEDWVKFYGLEKDDNYTIEASNLGDTFQDHPPVIEIYDGDDITAPIAVTSGAPPVDGKVWIDFHCTKDGIYYVKLVWGGSCDDEEWIDDKHYDLRVYDNNFGLTAIVRGKVRDRITGSGIDGAVIRSSGVGATISTHGEYLLSEIPGNWTLRARKSGYTTAVTGIKIDSQDQQIRKDLRMSPRSKLCSEDADCEDGNFCNGTESCFEDTCQPGSDPCGDDGLYCNGEESCNEENDICEHSGSPCPGHRACVDESEECVDKECNSDEECDDNQFCNGEETCGNGFCQQGITPCTDPTPACDEEQDICIEGPTIQLLPNPCMQSRWMPLLMILRIVGTNTHFDTSSLVTFDPPGVVMALPILGDSTHLFMIGLMMPSWLAPVQSVEVSVSTGSEAISETLNLEFLPFMMNIQKGID